MARIQNKRHSLYVQLLVLLLTAFGISAAVFLVLNGLGNKAIDHILNNNEYIESQKEDNVSELQKYIVENELSSRDSALLSEWVQKQEILSISIYKDGILVFDSSYPDQEIWEQEIAGEEYTWRSYHSIYFSDGEADVLITGLYGYRLNGYAVIVELCLSFLVFLSVVFWGVRKKLSYILKLSADVEVLEGGSLDCPITIKGEDELTVLAEGLENMRRSFQEMIYREEEMVRQNRKIVTEMSHDLRTPITSIMLYIEILRKEKYDGKKQLGEYLEKIEKKAEQLRLLTDHLFEYALIAGDQNAKMEEPEQFDVLFYDLISETCHYLEQEGFQTDLQVQWTEETLQICSDYVLRIMDNLTSNIVKYADPQFPVTIGSIRDNAQVGFFIENRIRFSDITQESTGIGIQNMKNMMKKMGGECRIEQQDDRFQVQIRFPRMNSQI